MVSVNLRAKQIAEQMMADAEALGLAVATLDNGAKVIDCGVKVPGSPSAGKLFAEACLGGLGQVSFLPLDFGDFWLPGVGVSVERPLIACMASQYAGWAISKGKFFAMGSGPARARYAGEELFEKLGYKDGADTAVLLLEGRKLPGEEVAEHIAHKCGLSPENLYLLIAPTASVVGSVQISARVVETGLHKLLELGFAIGQIISGYGTAPLASIADDDLKAIGRTNDAVLYGGRVYYTVSTTDEEIEAVLQQVPSSASPDYGALFYDLFQRYGGDFYKIDPLLFSPAEVCFNNVTSGRTFRAGAVNGELLRKSLLPED
jgi:methenyltetrahydromethanopterin cyclohydrolase